MKGLMLGMIRPTRPLGLAWTNMMSRICSTRPDDPRNVLFALTGKTDHEVELQVFHSPLEEHVDLFQHFAVGDALVDSKAQPVGSRLRSDGKSLFSTFDQGIDELGTQIFEPEGRDTYPEAHFLERLNQRHDLPVGTDRGRDQTDLRGVGTGRARTFENPFGPRTIAWEDSCIPPSRIGTT